MSNEIYNNLPIESYSLEGFNDFARRLYAELVQQDKGHDQFLKFVLTGDARGEHQAVVDPYRNTMELGHGLDVMRDYDSVIGISDHIEVNCNLEVQPVSLQTDALTKSIHLEHKIVNGAEVQSVPYHRIPNAKLATWGPRCSVHIFFPRLASEGRKLPFLSANEAREFYDLGLRPYVQDVHPSQISDWPAGYASEIFRATKSSGQKAYRTMVVPYWSVPIFGDGLRHHLERNGIEWAEGLFFVHTIRGIKYGTQHANTAEAAKLALKEMLEKVHLPRDPDVLPDDALNGMGSGGVLDGMDSDDSSNGTPVRLGGRQPYSEGSWWIDVGLEYSSQWGRCLQWMTGSHRDVVKEALRIDDLHASRITSLGSSKYSRDLASHLPAVSGCRIEPGALAKGRHEAAYLQMYTTDKSVTYQAKEKKKATSITMNKAMMGAEVFTSGLFETYHQASTEISSNGRIEVRVPWRFKTEALLDIDSTVICDSMLSFSKEEWWGFRMIRGLALGKVLSDQAHGPSKLRVKPEALLLTAACVWLINSLHSRPDDGPSCRNLMQAVLPATHEEDDMVLAYPPRNGQGGDAGDGDDEDDSDDEADRGNPYNPYGVIFLRKIMPGKLYPLPENGEAWSRTRSVPRMRMGGPLLSSSAFQYHFGATEEEVRHKYHSVGRLPKGQPNPRRPSNKAKCTPAYSQQPGTPEPIIFRLAAKGHALPPPIIDDGSDNEGGGYSSSGGIDQVTSKLWRQFLADAANKAPNPKRMGYASYSKLSHEERRSAREDHYKNLNLAEIWNACYWKVANQSEWDRAFDNLFPAACQVTSSRVQNYYQCLYYTRWKEICGDLKGTKEGLETLDAMRKSLKRRFNTLFWVPDAYQDKMWPTNLPAGNTRFRRFPPGSNGPAPRIIFRERLQGRPNAYPNETEVIEISG